jgi:hypothetical protein
MGTLAIIIGVSCVVGFVALVLLSGIRIIPNNKVWGDVINNVTAEDTRRVDLVFGISYQDDIEKARGIMREVVSGHELVLDDPAPVIRPQPGAELCDAVCAHIGPVTEQTPDALNCPEGLPVPVNAGGTVDCEEGSGLLDCITCTEFCVEQHQKGIYWNTECMQSVAACEEIETVCNDGGGV